MTLESHWLGAATSCHNGPGETVACRSSDKTLFNATTINIQLTIEDISGDAAQYCSYIASRLQMEVFFFTHGLECGSNEYDMRRFYE